MRARTCDNERCGFLLPPDATACPICGQPVEYEEPDDTPVTWMVSRTETGE